MSRIEARLKKLRLILLPVAPPFASFQPVVIVAGLAFVAGHPPLLGTERPYNGRVGQDLSLEQGQTATRLSGLNILAQMKLALGGDLDRIVRCVKPGVFVIQRQSFSPSCRSRMECRI